jgi:peptide/nickel transport system substrate-binding protein
VLSQVVFDGLYQPMIQPFNPGNPYLSADFPVPERDVAKAKALLKAAGHEKVSVELFVTNNPVDAQLGQVIQAMAQEAGIDVQIRSTEFASQLRDQQQGKFQMSRIGWSGRIDPDGNIHQFVTTKGNQNDGRYSNAEVDKLLDEARTVYDVAERKKRYDAAQKFLQDELPIVYLYNQTVFFALRSNMQGFVINPDGMIRLAGLKRQ